MFRLLPSVLLLLQTVITVRTELVVVPVVVLDASGHHVLGLEERSFRVYENGRAQPITAFHHGEVPITLGVVVDRSQSMRPKSAALQVAVSALLESSGPDDELFGVDFNDNVLLTLTADRVFTNNATELATTLSAVRADGRTALYDGVAEGLRHLELGHSQKNALIVVSDGGDNASRTTSAQVVALARRSNAAIYAIGLLGTPPSEEEEDEGLLIRLCRDSGGVAYFPTSIEEVAAVSRQIVHDLRDQYILGFSPGPRTVGHGFRTIEVKVSAPGLGRMHVRTRSGYVLSDEKSDR
jgi:Ca-activated chloride channel family protein